MQKPVFVLLILCIYSLYCQQTETKFEGKPFSSDESSKSLSNAFDDDLSTKFISSLKNGWVGLELTAPAKITKIGFAHSSSEPKDYLLGVFQGSNDRTFFDAFPLYLIKDKIEPNKINFFQITCPQKFKFIRYVGPEGKNSTISEFEIYGTLESDGKSEKEKYYQPTNIPLLIINSENSEMPQGRDKETKKLANFIFVDRGSINTKTTGTIKLRGNSSLNSEKKPYSINFEEKTKILDMPSNAKKWVLVPNMYDKTLMRNLLGYKMGSIFGLKYNPSCRYIDLILNGNYRGNYMICDKIEVNKNRVDISKMDETCVEEPEISGGYLIEGSGSQGQRRRWGEQEPEENPTYFKTAQGITFSYVYPESEDITEEQKTYIKNKFDEIEAKIYENNIENIDLESFARYFLVEDFSGNQDGIFNSFFIYKERGDDKLYFGPVWDFDLAFDNAMVLYPTNDKDNFSYKFALSNGSAAKLVSQILSNEVVLNKIKETWAEMTSTVFTKEIMRDFINEQIEYINESQKLNFMRWDVLNSRQFMEAMLRGSFEAEVEYLKEFVENRFDKFGEIVSSATTESVLEEVKKGGSPWGGQGGDRPWGGRDNNENKNN